MASGRKNLNVLRLLARSFGIATSYIDFRDRRVVIEPAILCGLINAVSGENIGPDTPADELKSLYARVRQDAVDSMLPATIVAWDGNFPRFWSWLKAGTKEVTCTLEAEHGGNPVQMAVPVSPASARRTINGKDYVRGRLLWKESIPYGYYTFRVKTDLGLSGEALLISAPSQLGDIPACWGIFAPVYALRSGEEPGIGGYKELLGACRLIKQQGGEFVGTLPLLPSTYEGDKKEISPYSPVSRLFWNELYLDPANLPGPYIYRGTAPEGGEGDVDYDEAYAFKKKILLEASRAFFEAYPEGDESFREFAAGHTYLESYADFRARRYPSEDYETYRKFHLYVQYACHLQLLRIRQEVESGQAASLYLDYTVGVHPDGFDASRISGQFLKNYQVGAPPDKTFISGQSWGFEPPHPKKLEQSRYAYLRDCFRHYFQYSKIVRIDHIMGMYRLYCIPAGKDSKHGTYVYYNANAQFGVLCLEAWRHGAQVVGEDLGIVPDRIRELMEEHKIRRMWIAQNEIGANLKKSFATIKPAMIACMNTHDMFPFASYLGSGDLEKLHQLDILNDEIYSEQKKERGKKLAGLKKTPDAFLTTLEGMAASKAQMVMINMEDLWEEKMPQNIPGTTNEFPNWRRKFAKTIEEWPSLPRFRQAAEILNRYRLARP